MISILLGSRGRPEQFRRMVESFLSNMKNPSVVEFVVYLDDDDPSLNSYLDIADDYMQVRALVKPRAETMSSMTNECFKISRGQILMMGADDLECKAKNWDEQVRNVFSLYNDEIVLVYCSDGHWGSAFSSHPFTSRKAAEILGEVCDGRYHHAYADRAVWDMYSHLGRTYYLPIEIRHNHHNYNERPFDDTDKFQKENFDKYRPDLLYLRSSTLIIEKANKLHQYMENPN